MQKYLRGVSLMRSIYSRWLIQLSHLLCISFSEKYLVGRYLFRWLSCIAVSKLGGLFRRSGFGTNSPLCCLASLTVLKWASPQAKMLPRFISGQLCPVFSHSSWAKFHSFSQPGASQSIRICSIESSTAQCSKLGMFRQCSTILCTWCIPRHR
jgi:hypothetical protein